MTDLAMKPGATLVRDLTVYADAAQTTPLDITDATIALEIYDAPNGEEVTDDLVLGANIVSEEDGTANVSIDVAADSEVHVYYYEIRLTEQDNTVTVIDFGKLVIR